MKVQLDRVACARSGYCAAIAPSVFTQIDDEAAQLTTDTVAAEGDLGELVREAALTCPAVAITVDRE